MNRTTEKLLQELEFCKNSEGQYVKTVYLKDSETVIEERVEESSTPEGFRTFFILNDQNDMALDIGTYAEMCDPWEVCTIKEFSVFLNVHVRLDMTAGCREEATAKAAEYINILEEESFAKIIHWEQEEIVPNAPQEETVKKGRVRPTQE